MFFFAINSSLRDSIQRPKPNFAAGSPHRTTVSRLAGAPPPPPRAPPSPPRAPPSPPRAPTPLPRAPPYTPSSIDKTCGSRASHHPMALPAPDRRKTASLVAPSSQDLLQRSRIRGTESSRPASCPWCGGWCGCGIRCLRMPHVPC
jgi:hypothetical protein